MPRPDPGLTMVDLFAGAGGLSVGLQSAGFTPLYANEIMPTYSASYSLNHPETTVDSRDIRHVNAKEVRELLGLAEGDLDLLAGGPPCQGFSINAPRRSSEDERNHLFREYLKFAAEFLPKYLLIENVPGLVSFERGATLQAIFESLTLLGYQPDVRILYAPHFGVPQTRWRTFVIASRIDDMLEPIFPRPTYHAPSRVNFTSNWNGKALVTEPPGGIDLACPTVKEAIGDLPPLTNGEVGESRKFYDSAPASEYQVAMRKDSEFVVNHEAPKLGETNMLRLAHIPEGGNWTDIPTNMLPAGMKRARRTDHTKRYGRLHRDGLGSTILTKCDPHWGSFFHYAQRRAITVREAARLQSFPDTHHFLGSRSEQYAQVGNAVPPRLAQAVGSEICHAILREPALTV